jgi:hypothetical protein
MTRVGERFAERHRMLRALGLASFIVTAFGCIDDRDVQLPEEPVQTKSESFEIPQVSPPPLDVLIVVDNSPAMAAFEDNVLANVPTLATALERNVGWWDRHIGVVTADVGCTGGGTWRPAQLTNDRFFIDWRHLDDTRTKNFDGTLEDHIPGAVAAGHEGCGAHRPLDAIMAALDPSTHFRREDADLIVIVLAASDDDSSVSVDEVRARVGRNDIGIDLDGSARSPLLFAFAPENTPRLAAFAGEDVWIGGRLPIDAEELFAKIWLAHHGDGWGLHCLDATLDMDRTLEGMQANCTVSDVVRDRDTNRWIYERVLPACTGANRPCWRLAHEPAICSADVSSTYSLQIDRIDFPPSGTSVLGQCEVPETP